MASTQKNDTSEIRVVLIGKTGEGKSSTGNNLLGGKSFDVSACARSVTKTCKRGNIYFNGKNYVIIDTPGLFDTDIRENENVTEIVRCIALSSPGPHVIVLVTSFKRFTKQEREVFEKFSDIFGEMLFKFLIVVFTRKGTLKRDNVTVDEFINSLRDEEKTFLESCENRYIGIENTTSNYDDATAVLKMISKLVQKNEGCCYTNDMYKEAEQKLKERMENLKKKREELLNECEKYIGFFEKLWLRIKAIFPKILKR